MQENFWRFRTEPAAPSGEKFDTPDTSHTPDTPDPPDPPAGRSDAISGPLLVVLILVQTAFTLRIGAAVIAGVVSWKDLPGGTQGQRLGESLQTLGGFADGQGLAMLLAAIGLSVFLSTKAIPGPSAGRGLWRWLEALFVLSVAGAAAIVVGNTFLYSGLGTGYGFASDQNGYDWGHILSTGGFSLSYLLVDVAGAIVCHRASAWRRRLTRPAAQVESNPYEQMVEG